MEAILLGFSANTVSLPSGGRSKCFKAAHSPSIEHCFSFSLGRRESFRYFSSIFHWGVEAVAAALLMNIYIVGLNQLSDIEIDKLPLLRWKRFAFVAALCILAVRAVIVQLAFFLHIQLFYAEYLLIPLIR